MKRDDLSEIEGHASGSVRWLLKMRGRDVVPENARAAAAEMEKAALRFALLLLDGPALQDAVEMQKRHEMAVPND